MLWIGDMCLLEGLRDVLEGEKILKVRFHLLYFDLTVPFSASPVSYGYFFVKLLGNESPVNAP